MKLFFIYFYYITLGALYILALPASFLICFVRKYRRSVPSRFFLYKNPPFKNEKSIWFHACSYGEVTSLTPLICALEGNNVNISVITKTGFDKACQISENVRFLPYEIFLPFWIKKQRTLVVTEAELWLMLFFAAKKKGIKTILINARISDRSYHRYRKFSWFYRILFSFVDEIYAQSETDKKRLLSFGAKNIKVSGNIKSLLLPKVTKHYKINSMHKKVITLASTHIGEEAAILEQLSSVDLSNTLIIVAPRHPERFEAVHKLLQSWANANGKTYGRFSKEGFDGQNDILLCDTMGELVNIYAVTDITILGGSFIESAGGHNPLEPSAFNNSIISGKFFFNQKELYSKVKGIVICDIKEIAHILSGKLPKTSTAHLENGGDIIKSILSEQKEIQ
ncbi:MAG: lipid IV(A) 3-deoxy-D-manno-octulosonic acid transferase [Campylobacteraceae bacterium]|jgi:3-deoxy-D-manno-octulosonic-acid transferase|nr:lipid IV(A) 3-deoxy-D-manno-octulosonic acid transferase [Campylobacteraceae bacterium]